MEFLEKHIDTLGVDDETGVMVCDYDAHIIYMNDMLCSYFDVKREDVLNSVCPFSANEDPEKGYLMTHKNFLDGVLPNIEPLSLTLPSKDGPKEYKITYKRIILSPSERYRVGLVKKAS